jgi:hypothetical protein
MTAIHAYAQFENLARNANVLSRIHNAVKERVFQRLGRGDAMVSRRGYSVLTTFVGTQILSRVQAQHALQQVQR